MMVQLWAAAARLLAFTGRVGIEVNNDRFGFHIPQFYNCPYNFAS